MTKKNNIISTVTFLAFLVLGMRILLSTHLILDNHISKYSSKERIVNDCHLCKFMLLSNDDKYVYHHPIFYSYFEQYIFTPNIFILWTIRDIYNKGPPQNTPKKSLI